MRKVEYDDMKALADVFCVDADRSRFIRSV